MNTSSIVLGAIVLAVVVLVLTAHRIASWLTRLTGTWVGSARIQK